MTVLWWLNTIIWAVVMAYMLPGAWGAAFHKCRRNDPIRLVFFATAFMMAGFSLRWIIAPDLIIVWKLLYVLSAAIAVYTIIVARAYGRGPVVG